MSVNTLPEKQSQTDAGEPDGEKGFVEIGRRLGIAIPAGLLLFANVAVNASVGAQSPLAEAKSAAGIERLGSNEVAEWLLTYAKPEVQIASAANCGGIHGDTHVNKVSPDVTNDGRHLKVHTDQHGDSCRY